MTTHRPLILIILDGWGYREETTFNAITSAHTPNWDKLWQENPHCVLSGSGCSVGLPEGQMGNSEVGHLTMGAGRIIHQDLTRIDQAIADNSFFSNPLLIESFQQIKKSNTALHIMGLLSPGGVHSHEQHIFAIIKLAAQLQLPKVYVHAFLDGRDTPPRSAMSSLTRLNDYCKEQNCGQIVSIVGRFYAMDRDKRWERVQEAYDLLTLGKPAFHAVNAQQALEQAYARGENDEFVKPTIIFPEGEQAITVNDGDTLFFANFRSDRAREMTQAFTDEHFAGFKRIKFPQLRQFICLSEYDAQLNLPVVFASQSMKNILAEYLSEKGYTQLRIAETEKYAHVTFFFNGGVETPYSGEHRILIPSPKVATYDLQPEMSAREITARLIQEINSGLYDVIICNFANADMVGHTGNLPATIKAIETLDNCLGEIVAATSKVGGEILITADHGNAEQLFDVKENQPHTAHTSEPVPFLYVGYPSKIMKNNGNLSDIAPTMLYLLGLPKPPEMTGESLLRRD